MSDDVIIYLLCAGVALFIVLGIWRLAAAIWGGRRQSKPRPHTPPRIPMTALALAGLCGLCCFAWGCASQRVNAVRIVVTEGAHAVAEVSAEFDRLDHQKQIDIANAALTKPEGELALKAYRSTHLKWWQAVRDLEKGVLALFGDVLGPRRLSDEEIKAKGVLLKAILREPLQVLEGVQ